MIPLLSAILTAAIAASLLLPQAATAASANNKRDLKIVIRPKAPSEYGPTDSSPAIASRCRSPNGAIAARATAAAISRAIAVTSRVRMALRLGLSAILSRPLERRRLRPVLDQHADRPDVELRDVTACCCRVSKVPVARQGKRKSARFSSVHPLRAFSSALNSRSPMEDAMRKSIFPFALAIFAAASIPAQAANFACTFYETGRQVAYCPVASDCRHQYSPTLHGVCVGVEQQIGCVFSAQAFGTTDVLAGPQAGASAAVPSFFANDRRGEHKAARRRIHGEPNRAAGEGDLHPRSVRALPPPPCLIRYPHLPPAEGDQRARRRRTTIGGTFAAVIGGAPGPRGTVCTTWLAATARRCAGGRTSGPSPD